MLEEKKSSRKKGKNGLGLNSKDNNNPRARAARLATSLDSPPASLGDIQAGRGVLNPAEPQNPFAIQSP